MFKYSRVATLARPLGAYLASAVPRGTQFDVIVPMPLHWTRRWRRGFNQSELLARALGRRIGVPVRNVIGKQRSTPAQAGLSNSERRSNVAGAFGTKRRANVAGMHVLLIDDVLTTGATASACASALKRAGARKVTVLTLARVDRRKVVGSAVR